MDLKLEVIITKNEEEYIARTPSFPHCIGKEKTLALALKKLSGSISKKIYNNMKKKLDKLFEENNYTEIITTNKNFKKNNHRVYNVTKILMKKEILIKYEELSQEKLEMLLKIKTKNNKDPQNKNAHPSMLQTEIDEDTIKDNETLDIKENNNQTFLYPISLN